MANLTAQSEEIIALQSIFDENVLIIEEGIPSKGRFILQVNLPPDFKICYKDKTEVESNVVVQHLPPVNLYFEFPPTYPSVTCPAFLLSCCWLTLEQMTKVCEQLQQIWERNDGEVILFEFVNFLQENMLEFLDFSDILDVTKIARYKLSAKNMLNVLGKNISVCLPNILLSDEGTETVQNSNYLELPTNLEPKVTRGTGLYDQRAMLDLTNDLVSYIKTYDRYKKQDMFETMWFACLICFMSKKGKDFICFNQCDHKYCRECLKSYFEIQIKDGNVNSLNCPYEKCSSQADGTLVKELVSTELFYKYDNLLLTRTLESMTDVEYCPRQVCQCPVLIELGSTMGCCPACKFTFCVLCRMVYHGVAPCNFKNAENQRICKAYLQSQGDERAGLEKRYGKKVLRLLAENVLSENWKDEYSKKCPRCDTSIEKTEGCNKMTCFRCGLYFCWLCLARLKPSNPYLHFSDSESSCYKQLFPPEELYDLDDDYYVEPGDFLVV